MKELLTDDDIAKIEQLYGVELTNFQKSTFKNFWTALINKDKDGVWRIDCNNCKYLNMTKEELMIKGYGIYKCEFYNKRIVPRINNSKIDPDFHLYPCDECDRDEHKNFSRRQKHRGMRSDIMILDDFADKV